MTPEQWSRLRTYDPHFDNPDPPEFSGAHHPSPEPAPFPYLALAIVLGPAFLALAIGALLAVWR